MLDGFNENVPGAEYASCLRLCRCRVVEDRDVKAFTEQIDVGHVRAAGQNVFGGKALVGENLENRSAKRTAKVARAARSDQLALVEKPDACAALGLVHVRRRDDDRHAFLPEVEEQAPEIAS